MDYNLTMQTVKFLVYLPATADLQISLSIVLMHILIVDWSLSQYHSGHCLYCLHAFINVLMIYWSLNISSNSFFIHYTSADD